MDLDAILREADDVRRLGRRCAVGRWLDKQTPEDRAVLDDLFDDYGLTSAWLHSKFSDQGWGKTVLKEHRAERCACQ